MRTILTILILVFCLTSNFAQATISKNNLHSNAYTFPNYITDQKAFEKADEHLTNNPLLQVSLPSHNRIILNYKAFENYRNNRLTNNFNVTVGLWQERSSTGLLLDKELCLKKLVNFEVGYTGDGPKEKEFVRCQTNFHTYAVKNLDKGIKLFQELFLLMAYNENDQWVHLQQFSNQYSPRPYHIPGVLAPFIMFYTVNYDQFDLSEEQRTKINNYFKDKAFLESFEVDGNRKQLNCPIFEPLSFSQNIHRTDNCGTARMRFAAAELALAITLQDELLWKKGLWDLDYTLSMIDHEGFWVPTSARGCRALGYTYSASQLISINVEMLNLAGFDLLRYKARHGRKISEAFGKLLEQYKDITISNHIAEKAIGSVSCGSKPYETHSEFLKLEHPTGEWIPSNPQFYNWSMRYIVEHRSDLIQDISLGKAGVHPFVGAYFSIQSFEIYNANISGKHLKFWQEKQKEITSDIQYDGAIERSDVLLQLTEKDDRTIQIKWFTRYANETSKALEASDIFVFDGISAVNSNKLLPKMVQFTNVIEDGSFLGRYDFTIYLTKNKDIKIIGEVLFDSETVLIDVEKNYSSGTETIKFGPGDELTISWHEQI